MIVSIQLFKYKYKLLFKLLSELVNKYNNSFESHKTVSYKKGKDIFKVDTYFVIGANYSDVSIDGPASKYMESSVIYGSSLGFKANVFMPNLSNNFSIEL